MHEHMQGQDFVDQLHGMRDFAPGHFHRERKTVHVVVADPVEWG